MAIQKHSTPADSGLIKSDASKRPFSKINFIMMACCLLLIIVGFLLMSGSGSSVEGGFNPDIFSTRRIVVGPLLAFLGFALMAFAIIYTPGSCKEKNLKTDSSDSEADK